MTGVGLAEAVATIELVQMAHKQGWFGKLLDALRKKHRVLVLGPTGCGKTQFLHSLTEAVPKAINLMCRTDFVEEQRIKILDQPFIFVDTPGQVLHKTRRIHAIREAMRSKIAGIINVVSFGYHESRAVNVKDAFKNGKINEVFLEKQRQQEINQLHEWVPLLGGSGTVGWLMTVVSKADLWWDWHEEVRAYYESGPYYKALDPARELNPIVLKYCSIFQRFYGEIPMSGKFEDEDRVRMRADLLRELLAAIGKA